MYEVVVDGVVIARTKIQPTIISKFGWLEVVPTITRDSAYNVRVEVGTRLVGFINGSTFRPMSGVCLVEGTKTTDEGCDVKETEETATIRVVWKASLPMRSAGPWNLQVWQKED